MQHLFILNFTLFVFSSLSCKSQAEFIPNQGQWHDNVLFRTEIPGGSFFAEETGFTYYFYDENADDHSASDLVRAHSYKVHFDRATTENVLGKEICSNYFNYFKGNSTEKWAANVYPVKKVMYEELYPGVNLLLYSKPQKLKYDFEIAPGGDPAQIQLIYEGVENLALKNGNLVIKTSVNTVTEHRPFAYQQIDGVTKEVDCEYILTDNHLTFSIGEYDPTHTLVIDPELSFSTFIGSVARNYGTAATGDSEGNAVSAAIVFEADYPTTMGAISSDFDFFMNSICDVAVSKFSSDGTELLYSTYLGGDALEVVHNIVCDSDDNIILLGNTGSSDFPTTEGAYSQSLIGGPQVPFDFVESIGFFNPDGVDLFITKIAADGSLAASTYFGGSDTDGINQNGKLNYNYGDMFRGEVTVDGDDNILVASITDSEDFPVSANAAQPAFGGGNCDAVVFKMDPLLGNLIWSTYFGGSGDDNGCSLELAANGDIIIAGGTSSNDLPTSSESDQTIFGGEVDGFIAKYDSNGNMTASTYNGTDSYDQNYFVRIDAQEEIFVMGQTEGDVEILGDVYSNVSSGQYIQKFSAGLNEKLLSTTIGSGSGAIDISLTAFQVTDIGQVCFSGWGGFHNTDNYATESNTMDLTITSDAYQSSTDGNDFYIGTLEANLSNLVYASYFGGDVSGEHVEGGSSKINKEGMLYQAVCAGCEGNNDFPTTADAWSSTNDSESCNLGVFKFDLSAFTTALQDETIDPVISFYPSPIMNGQTLMVGVKNKLSDIEIRIISSSGRLIFLQHFTMLDAGVQNLELNEVKAGLYFIQVQSSEAILSHKLVVID